MSRCGDRSPDSFASTASPPARRSRVAMIGPSGWSGSLIVSRPCSLAPAERHPHPELAAQGHRLRVVVAVDVRDEEAPHVGEPGVQLGETGREQLAGLRDGPARVDHA